MRKPDRRSSWKRLLGQIGSGFLRWEEENKILWGAFDKLAKDLETYLLDYILTDKEACEIFASNLPQVIKECNEKIYESPLMPHSYAFVHLLERYRRFWGILTELTKAKILPLNDNIINILDIGTGPAPTLYAISDYYEALLRYADIVKCREIAIPELRLESVESSREVLPFMHMFSELSFRRGPFHVTFSDFQGLNLADHRSQLKERRTREIADEDDTSEYLAKKWIHEYEPWWKRIFRYNLCVLSYFLTKPETVTKFEKELKALFKDLPNGGTVIVIGGTGPNYPRIYEMVEVLAENAGITDVNWIPRSLSCTYGDIYSDRIKNLYNLVWRRLESECSNMQKIRDSLPRSAKDLWDPGTPYKGPREFGLRVFRKGRW
jgi:hypothetical protein